jgi:CRP/FNR family transcriptional regulator, anaerobic regulatory protein
MLRGLSDVQFPFLARLSPAGRRELAAFSAARVHPGQRLLERGDAVDGAYLIIGGALRVYYVTAEAREATLYQVEPGGTCVLALTSAFNQEPYPAWVDAGTKGASFVQVPNLTFHRLFDREPGFREFIFAALSGRIFDLMQTLEEAGCLQLEQRVARYLIRRVDASDSIRISQAGIASELGTAREVVFRALRSLSARGLVRTGRMRIQIVDRPRLRLAAATPLAIAGPEKK